MKKATIAMVAVVFAAFAAQANTTSANIVGYSKRVYWWIRYLCYAV